MSDTRDPETDQRLPEPNDRPFVHDMVVADIQARRALGERKYGVALQSGNGRDNLRDAYEEALDHAIYLRAEIDERERAEDPVLTFLEGAREGGASDITADVLDTLVVLRRYQIEEGE